MPRAGASDRASVSHCGQSFPPHFLQFPSRASIRGIAPHAAPSRDAQTYKHATNIIDAEETVGGRGLEHIMVLTFLISPAVRRFVVLREALAYQQAMTHKRSLAVRREIEADLAELAVLGKLPQVLEFLELERERGESTGVRA
jgi:hypothetical protein